MRDAPDDIASTEIADKIVEFFNNAGIDVGGESDLDSFQLLEGDNLDSLGIVQLMIFLGQTFDIEIEDEDFEPENFETVGTLKAFVARKMSE